MWCVCVCVRCVCMCQKFGLQWTDYSGNVFMCMYTKHMSPTGEGNRRMPTQLPDFHLEYFGPSRIGIMRSDCRVYRVMRLGSPT